MSSVANPLVHPKYGLKRESCFYVGAYLGLTICIVAMNML